MNTGRHLRGRYERAEQMVGRGRLLPLIAGLFALIAALILLDVPAAGVTIVVAGLGLVVAFAVASGVREVLRANDAIPIAEDGVEWDAPFREWWHKTFSSLEDVNFRMLYLGNVAQFGSMQMQQVVRGWLVFHLTGSFAALGTMALANALPALVVSPIGGVVADRATKKTVIQAAQAYNAVNAGLLVILAAGWFGLHLEFWHLFLSSFLQGTVNSIMQPSRQAMISDLVPRERLMNAIGINSSGQTFMQLMGPGIAGFLIAALSPSIVFAVMAGMYGFAMACTMRLPEKPLYSFVRPGGARRRGNGLADLIDGFRYVGRDPVLRMVLAVNFLIVTVSLPYTQLLPGFVATVLKRGAFEQGMLQSVQGFGAIAGALFVASAASTGRGKLLLVSGGLLGIAIVGFSMSTFYWITLLIMLVLGAAQSARQAMGQVLIQEYSQEEYRGRVAAVFFMQFGLVQFGTFIVGVLAYVFGPQLAIGGLAVLMLLVLGLVAALSPTMRRLD